jgi:hypothetical protein
MARLGVGLEKVGFGVFFEDFEGNVISTPTGHRYFNQKSKLLAERSRSQSLFCSM